MKESLAQKIENPVGPQFESGTSFFQSFIPALIGIGFVLGVLFFFFYMMIGAIQWITSGGDKAGVEGARGKLTAAIIGIVILFATFALLKIIEDFFGINILTLDIGPLVIE